MFSQLPLWQCRCGWIFTNRVNLSTYSWVWKVPVAFIWVIFLPCSSTSAIFITDVYIAIQGLRPVSIYHRSCIFMVSNHCDQRSTMISTEFRIMFRDQFFIANENFTMWTGENVHLSFSRKANFLEMLRVVSIGMIE